MPVRNIKDNLSDFRKKIPLIAREGFYFFSVLILLGAVVEAAFPGLFSLYVNAALVAAGWAIALILMLIYVRR